MRWLVTQHLSLLYSIPSCPYIPSHPACCWLVLIFWGLVPPRRTSRIYTTGSERDQSRHEALQDADEQREGGRNKKEESHTPGLSMKFKKRPMFKNKTSNGSRRRRCVLHILSILLTLFFCWATQLNIPLMENGNCCRTPPHFVISSTFSDGRDVQFLTFPTRMAPRVSLSRHFVSRLTFDLYEPILEK